MLSYLFNAYFIINATEEHKSNMAAPDKHNNPENWKVKGF